MTTGTRYTTKLDFSDHLEPRVKTLVSIVSVKQLTDNKNNMIIKHRHSDLIRIIKESDHYFETGEGDEITITSFSNYDDNAGEIGELETRIISGNNIYEKLSDEAKEEIADIINDNH